MTRRNGRFVNCGFCNKPLYRNQYRLKESENRFCNTSCRNSFWNPIIMPKIMKGKESCFKGHNVGLCKKCGKIHNHKTPFGKGFFTPKIIKKISIKSKQQWEDPDFREKTIKAQLKGLFKRPTTLEKQMINIIKEFNLPYKYVGNGSFLIGWKNPDFINTNGEKICIEVANRYHHNEEYSKKRIEHFKKWGWKCIVFRENHLIKKEIVEGIRNFEKGVEDAKINP